MDLKSEQGQTVVEYILLFAVAASLAMTIYNSEFFKSLFGKEGKMGERIKAQTEFAYRHGLHSPKPDPLSPDHRDITSHPTYSDQQGGMTRFFGPRKSYP